ncbi:MAG: RecQ family ATP-dependent DNA helicase [Ignavibacteriaceae bacterium]|nr:RecQ family ATP-dependent DNA helicase [Ignavibacteriaceae bacterium]
MPTLENPLKILQEFFGYDNFRTGQLEIIEAVIKYNNVLVVLPTGAGKSICYQIPALLSENFSIIISPLIALMKDQVDGLNRKKEVAAFINSTMTYSETENVLNNIALGSIKLLYLAPEKAESLKFAERIKELKPKNLFVDEAHCISEWGHNFRPSYLKIKEFIDHIGVKKVSGFTATATPEVREDIVLQLDFKEAKIFVRGFERENLHIRVLLSKKKKEKCLELFKDINGPAIIYSTSRKKTEEVAEFLNIKGIHCNYYHAGLTAPERRRVQEEFIQGRTEIIAATNAFGMGIDKADIRLIIHYNTPGSIESFYQEIGRAGRDGKESFCYLLHDESDMAIQNFFISNSHPNKDLIQKIYKAVCDYNRVAVGSSIDKELIVDREYIVKYVGTEVSSGLLHSALKYLENSGYIRQVSEYDKKDSIQVLFSKEMLRQFVQDSSYQELANILISLLREYGSNILSNPIKISASHLANKLLIPEQIFLDSMNVLDNMGIISFTQAIAKETVVLTTQRVDAEKLILNYKLINESYLNSQHKLDKMLEFVFTNECRFKNILNYFGENVTDYRCGKCDNCISAGKLKDSSSAYLSEIILETLEEANEEIPENFLVNLLRGEKVKESAAFFKHFGTCKNFSTAEIKGVLADLISKRKILKSLGKRNYLSLPNVDKVKSERTYDDNRTNQVSKGYDDELYLFNLLREARKKAADRFMQSGYLICPDNVLREVARLQPKSKFELMNINGFNSRMFNKLGNDFLEIISSYKPSAPQKTETEAKQELPQNIIETKKLIQKKYTLKEIAETRKLSEAVISMQIETIVEFDPDVDISSLVKKDILQIILSEAKKGFTNLKELKERLPSKITYPEIRIAIAQFKAASQLPSLNPLHKQ